MPANDTTTRERQQQILQAAMTCFMAKGYHRATMDDIVAESGLSKGTLYWYFGSKKELFMALVQSIVEQLGQEWQSALQDSQSSAAEKLRFLTALFRVDLVQMAPFFAIMMEAWALTRHDPDVEALLKNMYKPYITSLSAVIEEGVANGEFEVASAEATAQMILVLYDGLTLAKALEVLDTDWDRLLDATEQLLFRGLGVKDERQS